MTRDRLRSDSAPMAVSSLSMTASVPSRIALATSVASARVGSGLSTIERSIWVAVMTGFAARFASAISSLLHDRHALDRDLDAEVAARDHDAVGGGDDLVDARHRLGLLDLRDHRHARGAHRRARSAARRTKESATRSTPVLDAEAQVAASLSVSDGMSRRDEGRLMPLPAGMSPPTSTRAARRIDHLELHEAVGEQHRVARPDGRRQPRARRCRPALPRTGMRQRSFGPPRSCRIATGRSPATRRMLRDRLRRARHACRARSSGGRRRRRLRASARDRRRVARGGAEGRDDARAGHAPELNGRCSLRRAVGRRRPRAADSRWSS